MTTPTSLSQVASAFALATAHGHDWTHSVQSNPSSWESNPSSWEELEAAYAAWAEEPPQAGREGWQWGLPPPERAADGSVRHATGTGRLEWTVAPNGDTTLRVTRPGAGAVLVAEVYTSVRAGVVATVVVVRDDLVAARHVECLLGALAALTSAGLPRAELARAEGRLAASCEDAFRERAAGAFEASSLASRRRAVLPTELSTRRADSARYWAEGMRLAALVSSEAREIIDASAVAAACCVRGNALARAHMAQSPREYPVTPGFEVVA